MSFSFKASSQRFIYENKTKNWTEAQRYCRDNYTDLASVRNESENNKTKRIIPSDSPDRAWIGLHRLWVWSDNSTSTFTHWQDGEPNIKTNRPDICASIDIKHYQGRWVDEECTKTFPFVCYDGK